MIEQKITNNEIYENAKKINTAFKNNDIKLPIKINFYLQKNKKKLFSLAIEIEQQRELIIKEYGVLNEKTQQYEVPSEKIQEASQKLNDLFNLTQEVKLYKVKLEDFGNIELTSGQMQALLFMIEDEEEEEE